MSIWAASRMRVRLSGLLEGEVGALAWDVVAAASEDAGGDVHKGEDSERNGNVSRILFRGCGG